MDRYGQFDIIVPYGEELPVVGALMDYESHSTDYIKGEKGLLKVIIIEAVEWDLRSRSIVVTVMATYDIGKVGLTLVGS